MDYLPNTNTGFSATLFRNKHTNDKILAIRGTEKNRDMLKDLVITDSNIAFSTMPMGQVVDMYKHIQFLQENILISRRDKLSVTVHSLGGFLSQIAAKSYPGLFDECYTFNAPSAKALFHEPILKNGEIYFQIPIKGGNLHKISTSNLSSDQQQYISNALYNYRTEPMRTKVYNVDSSWGLRPVNNLYFKNKFGNTMLIAGDKHDIDIQNEILEIYLKASNGGVSNKSLTDFLFKMKDLTNKPITEIGNSVINDFYEQLNSTKMVKVKNLDYFMQIRLNQALNLHRIDTINHVDQDLTIPMREKSIRFDNETNNTLIKP